MLRLQQFFFEFRWIYDAGRADIQAVRSMRRDRRLRTDRHTVHEEQELAPTTSIEPC